MFIATPFLRKIKSLGQFSEGAILCTIDVVGFYFNISNVEDLVSFIRLSDASTETKLKTKRLLTLEKIVLKKNVFQFSETNK